MNDLAHMLATDEGKLFALYLVGILFLLAILSIPTMIVVDLFQSRNKAYAR